MARVIAEVPSTKGRRVSFTNLPVLADMNIKVSA